MTDRRTTLKVITSATVAVGGAAVTAPALGLVASTAQDHRPPEVHLPPGGWAVVARFEDLPVGRPVSANVVGAEVDAWSFAGGRRLGAVWLIRDGQEPSTLRAMSAVCPHLGCLIEFEGDKYNCPCHGAKWDARGGKLEGPTPRGMDPLEVRVVDGEVSVKWVKFRAGTPARVVEG